MDEEVIIQVNLSLSYYSIQVGCNERRVMMWGCLSLEGTHTKTYTLKSADEKSAHEIHPGTILPRGLLMFINLPVTLKTPCGSQL